MEIINRNKDLFLEKVNKKIIKLNFINLQKYSEKFYIIFIKFTRENKKNFKQFSRNKDLGSNFLKHFSSSISNKEKLIAIVRILINQNSDSIRNFAFIILIKINKTKTFYLDIFKPKWYFLNNFYKDYEIFHAFLHLLKINKILILILKILEESESESDNKVMFNLFNLESVESFSLFNDNKRILEQLYLDSKIEKKDKNHKFILIRLSCLGYKFSFQQFDPLSKSLKIKLQRTEISYLEKYGLNYLDKSKKKYGLKKIVYNFS